MKNDALRPSLAPIRVAAAFSLATTIAVATALSLVACDKVDLDPLKVVTFPAEIGTVIGAEDAVWVEFSEEVKRGDAEDATKVSRGGDTVPCDASWDGNRLTLDPVEGWREGILYALTCEGNIETPDGRSFSVRESSRFYAVSSGERAVLLSRDPEDDAIVSSAAAITLTFSKPLDAGDLERYVTLSPDCAVERTLSESGEILVVRPVDAWEGLTRYRWMVSAELRDKDGIPVLDRYTGYFRVQDDTSPPAKPSVVGADPDDVAFTYPLDRLERDSGILFRFDEPIESDALKKRLSVEPALALTLRALDERTFLAYPSSSEWRAGTTYTITVGKGLSDRSGNVTTESFEWKAATAFSFLTVVSIGNAPATPDGLFEGTELSSTEPLKIGVDPGLCQHRFVVKLSSALTAAEASRLVDSISLLPVFPLSLGSPSLKSAARNDDGTVTLAYYDLELPDDAATGERAIYRLSLAGGEAGFSRDDGTRLESGFSLYLETVTP